jgi:hypothetical protein
VPGAAPPAGEAAGSGQAALPSAEPDELLLAAAAGAGADVLPALVLDDEPAVSELLAVARLSVR